MGNKHSGVIGIGYEGKDALTLIAELKAWKVPLLVDVRLNPISRKKGLSKTALRAALEAQGIDYLHAPELGNPKGNRNGYAEVGTVAGDAARRDFADLLLMEPAQVALDLIAHRARTGLVALLCFEAEERHCHRREVLKNIRLRIDALVDAT